MSGERGRDVEAVHQSLETGIAVLPPVVLSELLSDHTLSPGLRDLFEELPLIDVRPGYWQRVGRLRARILARRLRARLADALIAQSCIDEDVALVTRDEDFRHFARFAGLRIT